MIFVTVGTHEQPFTRLVEYMDKWAADHDEEVVIQSGVTSYEPKNCRWQKFYSQVQMDEFNKDARIVITHGGPRCFMEVLHLGKTPIVVPRQPKLNEHVDDHQVKIDRVFKEQYDNIFLIEDIEKLGETVDRYDELIKTLANREFVSNTAAFCARFSEIVIDLMNGY